jgi:hypothetical protein
VEGERYFFFWAWLVTCPVFSTGFQNYPTMDLLVELVGLLKHAGIDEKK